MARLIQPPPKFTHPEWTISNQMKYANAESERIAAERLVDESKRLVDETDKVTFKTTRDVNKKFEQRIYDVKHWEKEVDDKTADLKNELEALIAYKSRLDHSAESLLGPLHIAQQCLLNRQRRRGIELVHDDAEKELLKEVEVIQGALALLRRTNDQITEQARLNRKAIYNLEKDLKNKSQALTIDEHSAQLRNNSAGIGFKSGVAKIQALSTTPDEWQDYSNSNILDAEKQRQNSQNLRSVFDGIIQAAAADVLRQKEITDIALAKRIGETHQAKDKLETHLAKVKGQVTVIEDNIENLKKAIGEKETPLMVAHTRLENRSFRPSVELCRDPVQYRLLEETQQIETNIGRLRERLAQSEEALKGLCRRELELEEDIDLKANTLFIDETECMGMRKSISIQAY